MAPRSVVSVESETRPPKQSRCPQLTYRRRSEPKASWTTSISGDVDGLRIDMILSEACLKSRFGVRHRSQNRYDSIG